MCVVVHTFNPSVLEAETDRRISVRWMSAWSMGKRRLQSETLSPTKSNEGADWVLTLERIIWNEMTTAKGESRDPNLKHTCP